MHQLASEVFCTTIDLPMRNMYKVRKNVQILKRHSTHLYMLVNHCVDKTLFLVSVCRFPPYFLFQIICLSYTNKRNAATPSALSWWLGRRSWSCSPAPWLRPNDSRMTGTLAGTFFDSLLELGESTFLLSGSFGLLYWGVHSSSSEHERRRFLLLPKPSSGDFGDELGGVRSLFLALWFCWISTSNWKKWVKCAAFNSYSCSFEHTYLCISWPNLCANEKTRNKMIVIVLYLFVLVFRV